MTPITAPYRVPVFNELALRVDLRVVYLAERDPSRSWSAYYERMAYSFRVLRERWRVRWGGVWLHLSTGLLGELRRARGGLVLVGGWDQPLHHLARVLRRPLGYRFGCWVESTSRDDRGGSGLLDRVKRLFLTSCDVVVVPGKASAEYVAALGVEPERVVVAPNAVDASRFREAAVDRTGRTTVEVLCVGKLEPIKGVDVLLEAWMRSAPGGARLTFAGEGSLAPAVEEVAATRTDVRFVGHLDEEGLVAAYAEADVFVFPSRSDPWGLVLNEAMAAALPVVTTTAPGAVDDLVTDGWNGLIVPPGDVDALADALRSLVADGARRRSMGANGAERIAGYTPEACAAGLAAAASAGRDRRRR